MSCDVLFVAGSAPKGAGFIVVKERVIHHDTPALSLEQSPCHE
jgi:hypothetical protein